MNQNIVGRKYFANKKRKYEGKTLICIINILVLLLFLDIIFLFILSNQSINVFTHHLYSSVINLVVFVIFVFAVTNPIVNILICVSLLLLSLCMHCHHNNIHTKNYVENEKKVFANICVWKPRRQRKRERKRKRKDKYIMLHLWFRLSSVFCLSSLLLIVFVFGHTFLRTILGTYLVSLLLPSSFSHSFLFFF